MDRTFKDIITTLLTLEDMNRRQSYLFLKKHKVSIAQSSWYNYVDGYVVPSVRNVKEIFDAFGFEYTDTFLNEMLENSLKRKEENIKTGSDYIKTGVSLRVRNLSKRLTDESQIRFALNERIRDTGCSNLSNYIQTLICEDIDNEILKEVNHD